MTIKRLIEKHPEMESEIMELLGDEKERVLKKEYADKWWDWVKDTDLDKKNEYVNLPFEKKDE